MRIHRICLAAAVLGSLGAAGCIAASKSALGDTSATLHDRDALADVVVGQWSNVSALAARSLLDKYGTPDEVRASFMAWNGVGPWRRIAVHNVGTPLEGMEELGVIEQTISYPLTPRQTADVLLLDPHLAYNPREHELSAVTDREATNILLLNLADDVANQRANAALARAWYAQIVSLEQSGKTSAYMTGLRFTVGR